MQPSCVYREESGMGKVFKVINNRDGTVVRLGL